MPRLSTIIVVVFAAAAARADTLIAGNVSGVLDIDHSPYVATGNLTVPSGARLTISPGVVLRFRDRTILNVYGALDAVGTAQAPITFTADSTLSRGSWGGIGVWEGAAGTLRQFRVRFAGLPGAFTLPGSSSRAAALFVYRGSLTASDGDVGTVGGDALFYHNDGAIGHTLNVSSCRLADASQNGVEVGAIQPSDAIAVTGNSITGNAGYAFRVPAAALNRVGGGNALSGNVLGDAVAIAADSDSLIEDTTLASGVPYIIFTRLIVPSGFRLTAGPGVTLQFRPAAVLDVHGALTAAGVPGEPVIFTADLPPAPWGGIGLSEGAQATVTNAVVRWAGYPSAFQLPGTSDYEPAAIFAYRADLTMASVTVADSGGDGVYWSNDSATAHALGVSGCTVSAPARDGIVAAASGLTDSLAISANAVSGAGRYPVLALARALPGLLGNDITANALPVTAVSGGTVDADVALAATSRYRFLAPVTVAAGATLRVGSGARIDFASDAYLDVFGGLITLGVAESPVIFTSAADSPQRGDWGGIGLEEGAAATLDHAAIRYAGQSDAFLIPGLGMRQAGLVVNRASLTAHGLDCELSAGDGLFQYNPDADARTLSVTGGAFDGNAGDGARLFNIGAADAVTLQGAAFTGNGGYGLEVASASHLPALLGLTATGNALYPFRLAAEALPGLAAPVMSGNAGGDAVVVRGGAIGASASVQWPLLLEGDVTVAAPATLQLAAGTSVAMGEAVSLLVYGGLRANGTPEQPVRFLAAGPDQMAAAWGGIGFAPGSSGALSHVDVRAAGTLFDAPGIGPVAAAIACKDAAVSLDVCLLRDGAGSLLYLRGDALAFTARNTTLADPPNGPHARLVDAAGGGSAVFGGSNETGCDFISLRPSAVSNLGPAPVSATWCYWDAVNGPSPGGSGAGISGQVSFAPFLSWPRNVAIANGLAGSGDLNGNGAVDAGDAALALRLAAGWQAATSRSLAAADVRPRPGSSGPYGDGRVSLDDAVAILRQALQPAPIWP
jgi:hypothetical protein